MIDDIDMGITHVVRGEDHVSNTAVQLQMFDALGAAPPSFAHEALLTGTEGKLSKRLGSVDCDELREAGIEPLALAALLARLGTSDPVAPVAAMTSLIEGIDFTRFGARPRALRLGRTEPAQRAHLARDRFRGSCRTMAGRHERSGVADDPHQYFDGVRG